MGRRRNRLLMRLGSIAYTQIRLIKVKDPHDRPLSICLRCKVGYNIVSYRDNRTFQD